jgi:anti-sigma regulatory factor (Ser/Thr protein kinase)
MSLPECGELLPVTATPAGLSTASQSDASPASLRVLRYRVADDRVSSLIGPGGVGVPYAELAARAAEALASRTFMFYTVATRDSAEAHELCFVPKGDHCDILSIYTLDSHRRYGDLRRSLLDVLSNLAAAVACGTLLILDRDELAAQTSAGDELLQLGIEDSASLAVAREAADLTMREYGVGEIPRQRTVLGISEAATNILLHGGGCGHVTLRRLRDRLRFVVADQGGGLNFLNWTDRHAVDRATSMGYGFKIILDYLDAVGLHSGPSGTTLVLDCNTD